MTDTASLLEIRDPATGGVAGLAPAHTPADVTAAVARARAAQPAWAALGFRERARRLRRFARRLIHDDKLVGLIAAETGKPMFEAEFMEVLYTAELTRFFTSGAGRRALREEKRGHLFFTYKRSRLAYHPRGVVGVIGPFNWPLLNNYADCVAPLLAGNSVVCKPSPIAPLTSFHVRELWRAEGLPDGVFEVCNGGVEIGEALVSEADMIFFTGGLVGGRRVAEICARRLIPCVLELGGKNAMLVLRDADLEQAAHAAVWGACANTGQACVRMDRFFVEEPVAARFIELVAGKMRGLRQGVSRSALPPDQDLGPMVRHEHVDHLAALVREAVEQGARVVVGGGAPPGAGPGFFAPTLLSGVTPEMRVAREEIGGPILPVIAVRDADHALSLANALPVGLAGSIFSRDASTARALARRMQTGNVCINDTLVHYFCVESPLGGWKSSGLGVRHGVEALRQFCRVETIVEDRPGLGWLAGFMKSQLGMPYSARTARALRWLRRLLYG